MNDLNSDFDHVICLRSFYGILLVNLFTFPSFAEYVSLFTKQSFFFFSFFLKMLTWTDFISLNHSQKSDWWASVFSESCRAGAFPCFLIVLLIWKRDYFECFKIHVDCREVWWHSHWIFLCCDFFLCVCICKLEAKLHQNETDPKRTVHRMYTLSHHILNCVIRLSRKCLFFFLSV